MLLIRNCSLYHAPGGPPHDVRVRDGRIAEIGRGLAARDDERALDAGGRILIPGLIDVHVHGAGGADLLDGSPEALRTMSAALAREGVTSFLGTTVMRPAQGNAHLPLAAEHAGRDLGGARLLGLHLEGPFVNPERRGGLPAQGLYPPSPERVDEVLALTGGALRMITIAPELPGGLQAIERLAAAGVVPSFGHSAASYAETVAGIRSGIRHATHLFNAMPGLHHRSPGPLPALLEADGLPVQLISDDVHVDRHAVAFARRIFGPERIVCITDGMRTVGLPDGRYRFGDQEFESRGGAARYLDGTLIGTSLGLLQVVLRYREYTGCSLAEAVDAGSRVPARLLGLDKGTLEAGQDADLVLLDADLSVWATLVAGEVVYRA